jgi:phospholipid/cholesterol/gamma-HCH transport system permease protein
VIGLLSLLGNITIFGLRAIASAFAPPYEWDYLLVQIIAIGWQSVPLISAAGLALGVVMTLHTRSLLVSLGADAWAPSLQSATFFNELGPLVTALLVAGRVGSGIGAELANMRVTEQIDAIEVMSVDAFRLLVVTWSTGCHSIRT